MKNPGEEGKLTPRALLDFMTAPRISARIFYFVRLTESRPAGETYRKARNRIGKQLPISWADGLCVLA
jgi:hypothetical protein